MLLFFRLFPYLSLLPSLLLPMAACAQVRPASHSKAMPAYQTEKFELRAAPCGAKGYPMTIHVGNFIRSDGKSFPVPSGHTLEAGWASSAIVWVVGDEMQPAPDSLEILYFSYLEDQFYEGLFALPQQQIYALLKQGFWDSEKQQPTTYHELTVSVLPKGMVVVWLNGIGSKTLIGRFQASAVATDFRRFYPATNRAEMLKNKRSKALPTIGQAAASGTLSSQQWDEYLRTYPWQVAFNVPFALYRPYDVRYLNGELSTTPLTRELAPYNQGMLTPTPKAVPQRLSLYGQVEHGARYLVRIKAFDETETMAAFEALRKFSPKEPITLLVTLDKPYQKAILTLKSGLKEIPLLKSPVEVLSED